MENISDDRAEKKKKKKILKNLGVGTAWWEIFFGSMGEEKFGGEMWRETCRWYDSVDGRKKKMAVAVKKEGGESNEREGEEKT